ncbi:RNA polymerase sigma factor [Cyclobacterium plantarum]|uniref:Sigma-70 family RNA polymerase sigma factor n=1 Tax=Cyclobacterium plantarum TaxID=2716263 RepID=A0ABX0HD24_9BACT|nr:sigma-70 family RNA polymerase sigma factor [Cyclobacterium plantarum]NHE59577.1 sigma-70 family RNA polymerase sigma factor [Cyclobacterium plantarum]
MYQENDYTKPDQNADDVVYWMQITNDERAGMEALYVKYTRELFRLGMSIKGDRSLVKDCIQEVFLQIWQYRHTVKATDNVKLYLFKCLSNKIHKEVGKDKKRYGHLDTDLETEVEQETGAGASFMSLEKKISLNNALSQIPSRQKEVIHLLYYENHSYEDISKIMGINVQSVYTLAWKALANLKKRMVLVWFFYLLF